MKRVILLSLVLFELTVNVSACTSMVVGRKASVDGSTMTTHNDDCFDCDFRLAQVPARDYSKNSRRHVFAARFAYPRFVGESRGPVFTADKVESGLFPWKDSAPIGDIHQVEHTYSYLDGSYGIMNEHQLSIGESTCGAVLLGKPVHAGGHALFDISELSRVAMERCKTARCAIQLMGDLAVQHGFYGAEWEGDLADLQAEAGEVLSVADGREVWLFHVLPDGTSTSAVWAAQRVPDDHVSVVANMFVIRKLEWENKDWFMYSDNIIQVAVNNKLWDPSQHRENFDFQQVYATKRSLAADHYYARRMWRFFDTTAPSLHFSSALIHDQFPFSVKPDKPVSYETLIALNRDHYEGTPYDLTKGLAAGPYGNPNRYDRNDPIDLNITAQRLAQGFFERAISMFRTSYSVISQSRHWLPSPVGGVVWTAQHAPHASLYTPFFPAATATLPPMYTTGSTYRFNRDSSWWAFCAVENYVEKYYVHMIKDVQAVQRAFEEDARRRFPEAERRALKAIKGGDGAGAAAVLAEATRAYASEAVEAWWQLFDLLLTKYKDGTSLDDAHAETYSPTHLFYPLSWLQLVGFWPDVHAQLTTLSAEQQAQYQSMQAQQAMLGRGANELTVSLLSTADQDALQRQQQQQQQQQQPQSAAANDGSSPASVVRQTYSVQVVGMVAAVSMVAGVLLGLFCGSRHCHRASRSEYESFE